MKRFFKNTSIIFSVILLICALSGCDSAGSNNEITSRSRILDTPTQSAPPVPSPAPSPAEGRELKPGETLLVGTADFREANKFIVSFILSEDGEEAHSLIVTIEGLSLEHRSGNSLTTIQTGRSEVRYIGTHQVTDGKLDISMRGFELLLEVDGKGAEGSVTYAYSYRPSGSGQEIMIEMGTQPIKFTEDDS